MSAKPSSTPRVVLDTNVYITGVLGGRICAAILDALADQRFIVVLSLRLMNELRRALARPKLKRRVSEADREEFIDIVASLGPLVEPAVSLCVCRDPDDNWLIETAIAGNAEAIVTGDNDRLVMHPYEGIDIVQPADFLERLTGLKGEVGTIRKR